MFPAPPPREKPVAFTYDDSAIGTTTSVSRLRYRIGDTVEERALLTDGECQFLLDTYATADAAAIPAARQMLKHARQIVDWSSGQERETASQRVAGIEQTIRDLLAEGFTDPAAASGGIRMAQFARTIQGNLASSEFVE